MNAAAKDFPTLDSEKSAHDHLEIRCPRLGGQVTFSYCRQEGGILPCQRIIVCWQGRFPVDAFLRSVLNAEDWDRWTSQSPKEKVVTLLELIEAAKARLQGDG
jgi:hypothetical protein